MTKHYSAAAAAIALSAIASPAQAQIFWKAPDFKGTPVTSLEPGMGVPMPGANAAEQRAGLIWNLRSALNLAALQCQFEPTLRTVENYNAILNDHRDELGAAYKTLAAYFKRTNRTVAAGQKALDAFGTKTISAYSTVRGQLGFCLTSGKVGRLLLFAPRGSFNTVASEHLREVVNSLKPAGEQQFPRVVIEPRFVRLPNFDAACWDKKNRYKTACGYI
jgi:hypothetical protein